MSGPRALYLEMARLTERGLVRTRRTGMRMARTSRPMRPARSMTVSAMTPAVRTMRSRAALRAMVKLARSGSMPGWRWRRPWRCAGFGRRPGGRRPLRGRRGGAGAEDPSTQDAGFQFEVCGLDLPPFVVELHQLERGVAVWVGQGGDEPVGAGRLAGFGGNGDLRVDDADRSTAEHRLVGAVA